MDFLRQPYGCLKATPTNGFIEACLWICLGVSIDVLRHIEGLLEASLWTSRGSSMDFLRHVYGLLDALLMQFYGFLEAALWTV